MTYTRWQFVRATGLFSAAALANPAMALSGADPLGEAGHLVDPELKVGLADANSMTPTLSDQTLSSVREWLNRVDAIPPLEAPAVVEQEIPGLAGAPPVRIFVTGLKKNAPSRPAIINIHGGGFVLGTASQETALCQMMAAELDCVVVNVDYRLAPETHFPRSLEDNYAALRWLHINAERLGVDSRRIAVKGISAGGGHAAMLAIAARDRGEYPICFQALIYPMLDDRTGSGIYPAPEIGTYIWLREHNRYGWASHLGMPAGSVQPPAGAVPARVDNLSGLPPAFIGVGSIDLFVDEDIEYARRLADAGVPTELIVIPGAYHAFDLSVPDARVSKQFTLAWKEALRVAFQPRD